MSADQAPRRTVAPPPCPACGSTDVGPVVYGFPGEEMWDASRDGRIRLGGCVIQAHTDWSDEWFCRRCSADG